MMGGSESKAYSHHQHQHHYELLLSEEEKTRAQTMFNSISHGEKSFSKDQFQHFNSTNSHLDSSVSDRLFDVIARPVPREHCQHNHHSHLPHLHSEHKVTIDHFLSHLSIILNGSLANKARICVRLASSSDGKSVSALELVTFLTKIVESYEKLLAAHCMVYQSWIFAHPAKGSHQQLTRYLLSDLVKDADFAEAHAKVSFTESDVEMWLARCTFFYELFDQVLASIFPLQQGLPGQQMTFKPRLPQVQDTNWSRFKTILDFPMVLFLNHALPTSLQMEWRLAFSNQTHGGSFSQLLQCMRNKGPTYLVVRDQEGHVFGGFCPVSWEINAKFRGNSGCFLFKVNPSFGLYHSTGINSNNMYMNFQVETLPNGVGMGGQMYYFGLWIDQAFDHGHSKAGAKGCTTYGSPQLSCTSDFKVHTIEVWAVGKRKKREEEEEEDDDKETGNGEKKKKPHKSLLDKVDSADKAMLDMVDRGTISDAIRAEADVEETPAHNTIISPF